jgi:hypothetical protein
MKPRSLGLGLMAAIALLAVLAPRTQAAAQVTPRVLDEGSFAVQRRGAPAGTESFKIIRGVDGSDAIRATGSLTVGDRRLSSSLTTDSLGNPISYQLSARQGSRQGEQVKGAAGRPGRFSSITSDGRGNESMREYVVAPGATVVLDEDFVHQYYFVPLTRRGTGKGGPLTIIVPRSGHDLSETLAQGGGESIEVGGRTVTAARYTIGSGTTRREFWIDGSGRLLRVEVPSQGLLAVRDELPR